LFHNIAYFTGRMCYMISYGMHSWWWESSQI